MPEFCNAGVIMQKAPLRQAFTLIELLVVIFIIGLLTAIILPAVQSAREAARVAKCINNQKQIALALQHYEMSQRRLPGWRELIDVDVTIDGDPIAAQGSWVFALLPYMERLDLHDRLKTGVVEPGTHIPNIPLLQCPSHAGIPGSASERVTNYIVNGGAVDDCSDTDPHVSVDISVANGPFLDRAAIYVAGEGIFGNWVRFTLGGWVLEGAEVRRHQHTVAQLSAISRMDGTAHTLMTAENAQRGFWISEELYHFYHTPDGSLLSMRMLYDPENPLGDTYDWLPNPRNPEVGRLFPNIPGPGFNAHTIEGSVAFCWPRHYAEPSDYDTRLAYPRAEFMLGQGNTRQGFTGMIVPESRHQTQYVPIDRTPYNGQRIPAYLGLYARKTFNAWYQSARPSAFHVGVVVVSFCDSNVRKLNLHVDEHVFVHMMVASAPQSDAGWSFGQPQDGERNFLEGRLFDSSWLD